MKIVVFDLDETLGYFTEFGIFWDCLKNYLKLNEKNLSQTTFNDILDLYPEFIRPNIINILKYLKKKKISQCCHKMMIYTNNQGSKEWAHSIISYFENKIKYKLFDQIISAFKINGKKVEICRTKHDKCHKDFIKCTKLPVNAEICFIDDSYYPEMSNNNIYYINLKPYYYDLNFEEMMLRFKKSKIGIGLINNFEEFEIYMMKDFKRYNYDVVDKNPEEYEIEEILGKQIMEHLEEFFSIKNKNIIKKINGTRKNMSNKKNKTQRNN
jgi:hypothetical protein